MADILQTNISKCIIFNEKLWILIKISLKFVPKVQIDNKASLDQVMAWCQTGNKPLPERMMAQINIYTMVCLLFALCFNGT